jgi:hypothetical protein
MARVIARELLSGISVPVPYFTTNMITRYTGGLVFFSFWVLLGSSGVLLVFFWVLLGSSGVLLC